MRLFRFPRIPGGLLIPLPLILCLRSLLSLEPFDPGPELAEFFPHPCALVPSDAVRSKGAWPDGVRRRDLARLCLAPRIQMQDNPES